MKLVNIAPNFSRLETEAYFIYFSYETPIAFAVEGIGESSWIISENKWGPTTGKHLNYIDRDKTIRIPHEKVLELIEDLECL